MAGNAEMEDQHHLSLRLYEVLDMVGASEKMRNLHKRTSTTQDILSTVFYTLMVSKLYHSNTCGSAYEGSITPDLSSDVDNILCDISLPVVLDQREPTPEVAMLLVTDARTYPGYVKLQLMFKGRPLTDNDLIPNEGYDIDEVGRVCLRHDRGDNSPAEKNIDENGVHYRDHVDANKCNNLPVFARNRLDNLRQRRLISVEEFDKLQRFGCMFVAAGYYLSFERDIEWRLSFSLQERYLMSKLNPTQHKVYILLKIIKVNIIEKALKCKVFTSYHCKTCVLYAVEMTPRQSWTPGNIITCLMQCIKLLILWLQKNYCPNYFIKNQNLFWKRNFSYFRHSLLQMMKSILRSNNHYLQLLETDHIWHILQEGRGLCQWRNVVDMKTSEHMFNVKQRTIQTIAFAFPYAMYRLCGGGQYSAVSINDVLKSLQQTDTITEHTATETHSAFSYLYPWFQLHIAKSLASLSFRYHDRCYSKRILKVADVYFRKAKVTDLVNVRLAKATILYKVDQYQACFRLLQDIDSDFTFKVRRLCPCVQLFSHLCREQERREIYRTLSGMSVRKRMKYFTSCCVVFLPSQCPIVLPALKYEMFRSYGTQPGSRDEHIHFWFDWCVIDAKVYLYLMQYLVCSGLHKQAHKQVAMDNIRAVIEVDERLVLRHGYKYRELGHRETACNILGWIYMREQRYGDAVKCFLKSWKIRPFHNAAKFHMRDLLAKVYEIRR